MNGNEAYSKLKELAGLAGSIVILCGVLKFAGVGIPLRGEGWQIVLIGWGLKQI